VRRSRRDRLADRLVAITVADVVPEADRQHTLVLVTGER